MIDYLSWKTKPVAVTSVLLNPLNPRLPSAQEETPQRKVIQEMVENEKIYELAKNIASSGYFADVQLIVVKKDSKYIVLEGNRRICALKLLLAPESAPDIGEVGGFF